MILTALYELCVRENLDPDPGYAPKKINYRLRISRDGQLLALEPTVEDKKKDHPPEVMVPWANTRTSGVNPGFFVDNAQYVLGLGREVLDNADKTARQDQRIKNLHAAFLSQALEVAAATGDDGVMALALFGGQREDWIADVKASGPLAGDPKAPDGWSGAEVILVYLDIEALPLYQAPAVRAEWAKRQGLHAAEPPTGLCLITGEPTAPTRIHRMIKGVQGSQTSGAALVTFNDPSTCSHNKEQGDNAPCSQDAVDKYAQGLQYLLKRTEERRHQYGISYGDSTLLVWTKNQHPAADRVIELLDAKEVVALPDSLWEGKPRDINDTLFYGLVLEGNMSRIAVRSYISEPVSQLANRLRSYFTDLHLGVNKPMVYPLWRIFSAFTAHQKESMPVSFCAAWTYAALSGQPFPFAALQTIIARLRLPVEQPPIRYNILAAVLRRNNVEVPMSLDRENTAVPYILGRLFALLELAQKSALPYLSRGIREDFWATASLNPSIAFPRIMRITPHHIAKSKYGGYWDRCIGEVMGALPSAYPKKLSLLEQGTFALGYYQQREDQRFSDH